MNMHMAFAIGACVVFLDTDTREVMSPWKSEAPACRCSFSLGRGDVLCVTFFQGFGMAELCPPLTPADCDLRDFQHMQLDVVRLRDSDLAAMESPEACWAAVLLWCASWHQVPAASLPDDDRVLANLAGYGRVVKEWMRVRSGALRGWAKCSDGRLYHPVVAEKANEAWDAKRRQRWKTECARIKKHNDRHGTRHAQPTYEDWLSLGCPSGQLLFVPRDNEACPDSVTRETHSKGEGEGEGYIEIQERTHTPLVHVAPVCVSNPADDRPIFDELPAEPPQAAPPPRPPAPPQTPTAAGLACLAMRAEGIADVNPASPKLAALLEAGATNEELAAAARGAVERKKGFAYALGTAQKQREEAAAMASGLHTGPLPARSRSTQQQPKSFAQQEREAGWARWEQMTNRQHPDRLAYESRNGGLVIEAESVKQPERIAQ